MKIRIIQSLLCAAVLAGISDAEPIGMRVINGQIAYEHEFPFIAFLEIEFESTSILCGGSIITPYHILTAAHCVPTCEASDARVVVGTNHPTSEKYSRQTIRVTEMCVHQNYSEYDNGPSKNDIAILTLEKRIQFTQDISQICLPANNLTHYGTVQFMGWGITDIEDTHASDSLMKGTGEQYPCNEEHKFCLPIHPTSPHKGDSGSPVVVHRNRPVQVGIVSDSNADETLGLYVRVSDYVEWIERTIEDSHHPTRKICKINV